MIDKDNVKKSYRVVLSYLRPPESDTTPGMSGTFEHIGIQFLKAAIKDLCEVNLIDGYAQNIKTQEVLQKITQINPDFAGFSPTVETINDIIDITKKLKVLYSNIHICLGGHHATMCAKEILENEPSIDTIILGGDGEESLRELIQCLISKKKYLSVLSVAYRFNNCIYINKLRAPTEPLDEINPPVRDTIKKLSKQKWDGSARISTSRGCIYSHCTFCTIPDIFGCRWRPFSAEKILEEITQLYEKYNVKFLWFSDDQFVNSNPESTQRAKKIAIGIIERDFNLYFRLMCRADDFTRDKELIPLLYKAGWRVALVGFESGSERMLKTWRKGLTKKKNMEFAQVLRNNKIGIQAGFIMFDPTNSIEELEENATFLFNIKEARFLANLVRRLRMLPGTQVHRDYLKLGLVSPEFNYKSSSYDYRFTDSRIGQFALWLDKIYLRNKKYDDTFWSILNLHLPIFIEKFVERYGEAHALVGELKELRAKVESDMNVLNYEFFITSLHQVANNSANILDNIDSTNYESIFARKSNLLNYNFKKAYKEYSKKINYPFLMFNFTHDGYTEVIF